MNSEPSNEATIFVFYTMGEQGGDFVLDPPNEWWWVGSGHVMPFNSDTTNDNKHPKFEREIQFSGPKQSKKTAREYFKNQLNIIKNAGIIKRFKIRNSYLP